MENFRKNEGYLRELRKSYQEEKKKGAREFIADEIKDMERVFRTKSRGN